MKTTTGTNKDLWLTCPNLVTWKQGPYLCVFNSLTTPVLSIMSKEMAWLLKSFKVPTSKQLVYQKAKRLDPSLTPTRFNRLHKNLTDRHLLIQESQLPFKRNPPHHLGVWLHMTNQCNLRCTYCYIQKSSAKFDPAKLIDTLTTIFASASSHDFHSITLKMSGGECLLELNQVLKVVELGQQLSKRFNISFRPIVMTNGVLVTARTAQILKKPTFTLPSRSMV